MKPFIAALMFLFSTCTFAEKLAFTGNEARAPKIYNDQKGKPRGILIEIMKYLEVETGNTFTFELLPFARAVWSVDNKSMGIIGFSKTAKRLEVYDFAEEPLYYDEIVLVVKKGKEFPFRSMDDLKGKKIGTVRGGSYGEVYETAVTNKIFEPYPNNSPNQSLAMLLAGRLDAVFVPSGKAGLEAALNSNGTAADFIDLTKSRDELVILPKPFAYDPNYMAFAKTTGKKDFLHKIDAVLKKPSSAIAIKKIIDNYSASMN